MEWSDQHDVLLCREILIREPFKAKRCTPQRSQLWQSVADHLNAISEPKFKVSKRAVRERFTLLAEKFKKKMKTEEKASGIDTELTELDVLLEEVVEKEEELDKDQSENNAKEEQSKAETNDMRLKAMESLKESKKRKSKEQDEKRTAKKKRGSKALEYLKQKMDELKHLREQELEIKRKEQERETQKQKLAEDQHKDMMAMMNQQQREMQQMQMRFFEQKQQQNNLLLAFFQKALFQ